MTAHKSPRHARQIVWGSHPRMDHRTLRRISEWDAHVAALTKRPGQWGRIHEAKSPRAAYDYIVAMAQYLNVTRGSIRAGYYRFDHRGPWVFAGYFPPSIAKRVKYLSQPSA